MRMPEAHGTISFKLKGIERVTGMVVNGEPMVKVRFTIGNEITAPLIPTVNALLGLDYGYDTFDWAIIRGCLSMEEVLPKKVPVVSEHPKEKKRPTHSNRSVIQKPF